MARTADALDPAATRRSRQGAVEVFDRWYAAHEADDSTALAAVLHPAVEVHSLFRDAPVRGRAAAVAHFRRTMATFPDLSMALVSGPAAAGNGAVLAEVTFTGSFRGELTWGDAVHRGDGRPFAVPGALVLHTRDGSVTSVRTLFDRAEWLRQIGVTDAPIPAPPPQPPTDPAAASTVPND